MSDAQAPVAFRLRRPYDSEDEFVAGDGPCIDKGGMTLVGAGPRPSGLVVRFEVALRDGAPLFRGEARVLQHRAMGDGERPAGLEIRFTKLDVQGKAIVGRVLRERAAAFSPSPAPVIPDLVAERDAMPAPAPAVESGPVPPPSGEVMTLDVEPTAPSPPVAAVHDGVADALARLRARSGGGLATPSERLSLLERLRARRA